MPRQVDEVDRVHISVLGDTQISCMKVDYTEWVQACLRSVTQNQRVQRMPRKDFETHGDRVMRASRTALGFRISSSSRGGFLTYNHDNKSGIVQTMHRVFTD